MRPVVFSHSQPPVVQDHPRPERLVQGNPARGTQSFYASGDRLLDCGIWSCEIGAWRIRFSPTRDEFFTVMQGLVRLHAEDGESFDVAAGDAAVIPAGFTGVFEVVEPVRKYYVLLERQPDAG